MAPPSHEAGNREAQRKLRSVPARIMHAFSEVIEARKPRMKRLHIIGLALAAALCAGQANAEELTGTLKKVKETGTITIGYRDSSIPFSYLDDNQKPIGFAIDICYKIVDAVKAELKLDKLAVELNPVTSSTRIPL
jgi:glutamate/aspartate transport system substrate-binding protein